MHVCVVDAEGQTREHINLPCDTGRFLKLIGPYREQLVVACECLFAWYSKEGTAKAATPERRERPLARRPFRTRRGGPWSLE
jgi:hypothetical protein